MILTNLLKSLCSERAAENFDSATVGVRLRKLCFGFVLPGVLVAAATGTYQMLTYGMAFYMKQGWFHAKLTLVAALVVTSVIAIYQTVRAARGERPSAALLLKLHAFSGFCLVSIVFLVFLGRV